MKSWKEALLKPSDSIEKAIQVLDRVALRIVMVAKRDGQLLGTITDGDIRRALIRKYSMDTSLDKIMNRNPVTACINDKREDILNMLNREDVLQAPVLDASRKIVGLEILQNLLARNKIDNPVFLMAGGFGKRLGSLTKSTPKPLLKVGKKPILETILGQFVEAGFHDFYISVHYKAEQVIDHFGDGGKWGVNISYVHEEKPLGTAGALGLLPAGLIKKPIVMMNGDLLTKVNLRQLLEFHQEQDCIATMGVREYDLQVPYGVIEQEGNIVTGIVEKPVHSFFVNAGIYVLEPRLLKTVKSGNRIDMPNLLKLCIESGERVITFPIHEYWLDVGRLEQYEQANREIYQ